MRWLWVLVAIGFSGCSGGQSGTPSSLQACGRTPATEEPDGRDCTVACPNGEACNSSIACGPPANGVWSCRETSDVPDERCHRKCESLEDCAPGEDCVEGGNFGCDDVAVKIKICCVDGDCKKG